LAARFYQNVRADDPEFLRVRGVLRCESRKKGKPPKTAFRSDLNAASTSGMFSVM
jgi:hypothetical protein